MFLVRCQDGQGDDKMAVGTTTLASRAKVVINSTDFSGDFNQAKLNYSQNELDVSVFGGR